MFPEDSYRHVLANRNFLVIWFGQGFASLGQAILYVAVALYVYELTGAAEDVSLAIALELLPWVVIGPIAGILADRLERKTLLVGGYILQAALIALMPFAATRGQIYVLIFLSSMPVPVSQITRAAALPSVTGIELFMRGSSLDIAAFNIAGVIGPILGGILVGVIGAKAVFLVIAGFLLVAALLSLVARIPSRGVAARQSLKIKMIWRDFYEAAKYLVSNKVFRFLLLLNFVLALGWTSPDVAAVVYLTEFLNLSGQEFGLLHATMSLSIALTVFILGHLAGRMPRSRLLVGGAVVAGLAYTFVFLEPGLYQLLIIWAASGLGWGSHWLIDQTLWAEVTPDEERGRIFGLAEATVAMVAVIAALAGGWLISSLGPVTALTAIGLTIAIGALAVSFIGGGYRTIGRIQKV